MFTRMSFTFAAALMLLAGGGVANAASLPSAFDAGEAGIPDSVDNADRMAGRHSPTNAEINAGEAGNPDSIENKDQRGVSSDGWRAAWQALEVNHPDFR